jgi:hypothetical protein
VRTTIDIDPELLAEAEDLARRKGQALSVVVEEALRRSLSPCQKDEPATLYGEPLTVEDIEESARVAFRALDEEENRAAQG